MVGTSAFKDVEELQILNEVPAFTGVGSSFLMMVTSLLLGVQIPFEMVQRKTLVPKPKLLTLLNGFVLSSKVPLPLNTVHSPVPTVGVLAASDALSAQTS